MAEQSGLTQEVCLLSFPTMTGDFHPGYHSRGENSLLVLDLRATAYNLVFLFFFSLPVEPFMRMTMGFHIFLYYIFAILGWKWAVEVVFQETPHHVDQKSRFVF